MTDFVQTACPGCGQIPCNHNTACCPLPPTLTTAPNYDPTNQTLQYRPSDWDDNVWIPVGKGL